MKFSELGGVGEALAVARIVRIAVGDLSAWFSTGVWQMIFTLLPFFLFWFFGGATLLGVEGQPVLKAVIGLLLLLGAFTISGWGARMAVGKVSQ